MVELPERVKEMRCSYCSHEVDGKQWDSEWHECHERHYKSIVCENCGKKDWMKANFNGSGHDCVVDKLDNDLESTLRKVSEGKSY